MHRIIEAPHEVREIVRRVVAIDSARYLIAIVVSSDLLRSVERFRLLESGDLSEFQVLSRRTHDLEVLSETDFVDWLEFVG